jgi:hypothetical protein
MLPSHNVLIEPNPSLAIFAGQFRKKTVNVGLDLWESPSLNDLARDGDLVECKHGAGDGKRRSRARQSGEYVPRLGCSEQTL